MTHTHTHTHTQSELRTLSTRKLIEHNGKIYFASSFLAVEVGYDADHISRLARQGKVDAIRTGKERWFVTLGSLLTYKEQAAQRKAGMREKGPRLGFEVFEVELLRDQ